MDYNKFLMTISGAFPQEIQDMISNGNSIYLSITGNCVEGRHSIILDNINQQNIIEFPILCPISGSCAAAMQRAICNQKLIDIWVKLLVENIKFTANLYYCKSTEVIVQDTFIYKNRTFFSGDFKFDKPHTYYIHPYMHKRCSESEIKEIISSQTNAPVEKIILKTGIWNKAHYFTFEQFNVEYMQPEEDDF